MAFTLIQDSTSTLYKQTLKVLCQVSIQFIHLLKVIWTVAGKDIAAVPQKVRYENTSSIICIYFDFKCSDILTMCDLSVQMSFCAPLYVPARKYLTFDVPFLLFTEMYINQIYQYFMMFLLTLLQPTVCDCKSFCVSLL